MGECRHDAAHRAVGGRRRDGLLLLLLSSRNRLRSVVMVMKERPPSFRSHLQRTNLCHQFLTHTHTEGTLAHTDTHNDSRYYEQSMQH